MIMMPTMQYLFEYEGLVSNQCINLFRRTLLQKLVYTCIMTKETLWLTLCLFNTIWWKVMCNLEIMVGFEFLNPPYNFQLYM